MQNNYDINSSSPISNNILNLITTKEQEEQNKYYKLIDNYERLVKSNVDNLKRMLNTETNKSVIIYNFGLVIELFLKMILLKLNILNIEEIGESSHNISNMFKEIIEKCNNSQIKEMCQHIKERAALIKQNNNSSKKINYNDYIDFRYNHPKGKLDLIFTDDIDKNDIKHIKEVLGCIELIMK